MRTLYPRFGLLSSQEVSGAIITAGRLCCPWLILPEVALAQPEESSHAKVKVGQPAQGGHHQSHEGSGEGASVGGPAVKAGSRD